MTSQDEPFPSGLRALSSEARRELLAVLMSPSSVRADVIRQFHERGDDGMVAMLTELEADGLLRWQVVEALKAEKTRG